MSEEATGVVTGSAVAKQIQLASNLLEEVEKEVLQSKKNYKQKQMQKTVDKKLFDLVNERKTPKTSTVAEMIEQDPNSVTRGYYGHSDDYGIFNDMDDTYNVTPVYNAASNGHSEALDLLIEAGGNVDDFLDCDAGGLYAIGGAVLGGHYECVEILAKAGANLKKPYLIDVGGLATQALVFGHIKILRYLTSIGVGPIDREDALGSWSRDQMCKARYSKGSLYRSGDIPKTWSDDFEDACQENISIIRLNKRPVTLTACLLKEIGVYHMIDSESLIDLRDYLGRPGEDYPISKYPAKNGDDYYIKKHPLHDEWPRME